MKLKLVFLAQNESVFQPSLNLDDAGLVPLVGDRIATGAGSESYRVDERIFHYMRDEVGVMLRCTKV